MAVAKVMLLPYEDHFGIVPVICACLLNGGPRERCISDVTLHYLQHEFCHVHDNNKKIDALSDVMLRRAYIGKDVFVGPLSEAVWSEYFANRRSSTSVTERIVCDTATRFKDAIARTEALVDPLA
jgi:hypothetical protein